MSHQFYANGLGDRLVDDSLLPAAVRDFLAQEERLLAELCRDFDSLVELGSMYRLHLEFAVHNAKNYLGLDVVERYVTEGNRRVAALGLDGSGYKFLVCGIEDMGSVSLPTGRTLAFSPFNCVGNIPDLTGALKGLASSGLPFLLSSYRTDPLATRSREEYYAACGYTGMRIHHDPQGVRFTAADGLHTVAYEPNHMLALLAGAGIDADVVHFGDIGACYVSRDIVTHTRDAERKLHAAL
jgi:hypothetical protein